MTPSHDLDADAFARNPAAIVDADAVIRAELDAIRAAGVAGTATVGDQIPRLARATRLALERHADLFAHLGERAAPVAFACLGATVGIEVDIDPDAAVAAIDPGPPAVPGDPGAVQ